MKNILAYFQLACFLSTGLVPVFSFAVKLTPCERALLTYSHEQILSDAGDLLGQVVMPKIYPDEVNSLMGIFEPIVIREGETGLEEELQTARDYATYVHNKYDQKFIFARTYKDTYIPMFDGLVLENDGTPAFNVSLKHISVKVLSLDEQALYVRLHGRMDHERNFRLTESVVAWLKVVNNWRGGEDEFVIRDYARDLKRGVLLAHIFGVNNPRHVIGRQLETVVDLRYSGYTYEFVNRPRFLARIERMVEKRGAGVVRLTLLWDPEHVIEIGR